MCPRQQGSMPGIAGLATKYTTTGKTITQYPSIVSGGRAGVTISPGDPALTTLMADSLASTTPTTADLREPLQPAKSRSLDADIIIKNAPDPVFVSDLEGKILSANDAVYELLGFRTDEVLEQSLSRFISPEETREFTAALREVIERGVIRNTRLNPRSASGEIIPTSLNASALRDADGKVIGAIGILRDMRELD